MAIAAVASPGEDPLKTERSKLRHHLADPMSSLGRVLPNPCSTPYIDRHPMGWSMVPNTEDPAAKALSRPPSKLASETAAGASRSCVALLRAVNVGGTGKLPMGDLKEMCVALGFASVRTYIASGNVVFMTDRSEGEVKRALEERLHVYTGKPVRVILRTALEIADVLRANEFPNEPGNRTVAFSLDDSPSADLFSTVKKRRHERLALGKRAIYVASDTSKLAIPAAATGTARNMNTVAKLAELSRQLT